MNKILVLMLAGIGDSLLATPMLAQLRKRYPHARITTLVMYDAVRDTLLRNPDVDKVVYFNFMKEGYFRSLRFVLNMRKEKYDLSLMVYPSNRLRPNVINFLIGARQRLGHLYEIKGLASLSFLLYTDRVPIYPERHTIDENLKLLEPLGINPSPSGRTMVFSLTGEEKTFARRFLKERSITKHDLVIGVHAGSSELAGMMLKRWPKEKFAAVCDRLIEEKKAKILLFGGNNEMQLKHEIADLMRHKPLFVNNVSFFQSAALIARCTGFLCNDTGLMHIASYFEIPTVVVTGHNNPLKTRPLHAQSRVLVPPIVCRPYRIGEDLTCLYAGTPRYCLHGISVDAVYHAMEEVLP